MKAAIVFVTTALICSAAMADLNAGLVAAYDFDGNANDSSGNHYNGTVHGGAALTTDRFGHADSAYDFDGVDGYIDLGNGINSKLNSQVTLSAWVMPEFNEYGDRGYLTSYWYTSAPGGGAGLFAWTTGTVEEPSHKLLGFISNQSGGFQSAPADGNLVLGEWMHIAMTYDNNTQRLYVNGEEIYTYECGAGYLEDPSNNNPFYIAKHSYSELFNNCKMDDVRIYDRALSSTEITDLQAVPEPATFGLLIGAGLLLAAYRRWFGRV